MQAWDKMKEITWEMVVKTIGEYCGSHDCFKCIHQSEMPGCWMNHKLEG